MKLKLNRGILLLLGTLAVTAVHAHEATERYIPIGESPGMSSKHTVIGTLERIDRGEKSMIVASGDQRHSASYDDNTRIWIDRSRAKLTNLKGSSEDLKPGRFVEVKYKDAERQKAAEWIKVRMQ